MVAMNFTIKPKTPIIPIPNKLTLIYIHVSSRLGLPTNLINLLQEDKNDLIDISYAPNDSTLHKNKHPIF